MVSCWVKDCKEKASASLTVIVPAGDPQNPYLDFCKEHYYEIIKKLNLEVKIDEPA